MSTKAILAHLRHGPATNAELQDAVIDHSAGIARDCARLMRDDLICRIDGKTGRGTKAIYALARVCVNAHDRCYGGAGGPCPYCEIPEPLP